jgi:hypothetical protein
MPKVFPSISAATDTTLTRIFAFFAAAIAEWTLPGSHVESAETTNKTSRDPAQMENTHRSQPPTLPQYAQRFRV